MRLIVVGALFLAVVGAGSARADGYPTKPIYMIVPLDAGSSADGIARIVLPSVSKILGQQIIIDNEGGAASISVLSTQRTHRRMVTPYCSAPLEPTHPIRTCLPTFPPPGKDFTAVARVATKSSIMAVPTASSVKIVGSSCRCRERPPDYTFASAGIGTSAHLAAELLKLKTSVALKHIPYKGGPQPVIDLMRGDIDMTFYSYLSLQSGVQSGKLTLLAVAGTQRSSFLPDLPTLCALGLPTRKNRLVRCSTRLTGTPAEAGGQSQPGYRSSVNRTQRHEGTGDDWDRRLPNQNTGQVGGVFDI